jgi:hypothetical protein
MNHFLCYRFHFFMRMFSFALLHSHQNKKPYACSSFLLYFVSAKCLSTSARSFSISSLLSNDHHLSKSWNSSEERRIFWKCVASKEMLQVGEVQWLFQRLIVDVSRHLSVATVSQSSIQIIEVVHELIKSRTVDGSFFLYDRLSL